MLSAWFLDAYCPDMGFECYETVTDRGRFLNAENDAIMIRIPLDYGIRITHFSLRGGDNVYYEQPSDDNVFVTEEGWRLYGGHRMWVAPESSKTYWPDNQPVSYEIDDGCIVLKQQEDLYSMVKKTVRIMLEGNSMRIEHVLENTGRDPLKCSVWCVTSMKPGGIETIGLETRDGGMDPWLKISAWDYTNLTDPRAEYYRDRIVLKYKEIDRNFKIGVSHPIGSVSYVNDGYEFIKRFNVDRNLDYPDGNASYEAYMSKYMIEMESLSPYVFLQQGQTATHTEIQSIRKLD